MAKIVYISRAALDTYGAEERELPDDLAEKLVNQGVARLVNIPPAFNPDLIIAVEAPVEKKEVTMLEEGFYTHVGTIGPLTEREEAIAQKCGFAIHNATDKAEALLLTDLVLVTKEVAFLPQNANKYGVCFFQKNIPFVFRITAKPLTEWNWQLVARSRLNIFSDEEIKKQYSDLYGTLIDPCIVIDNPYQLWRSVSKMIIGLQCARF